MFQHRTIRNIKAEALWNKLKITVSKEKAFQASMVLGELAAEDMLDFSGMTSNEIDRIYVKFRDGMPMAAGIRKKLPQVDIRYIVSQLKQGHNIERHPLSFWEGYDGYSNETIWFADPINATGHTAIESLRFLRDYFSYKTALISHIVANLQGIKLMQTTLVDFNTTGFMNYAHLSKKINPFTGYLVDGLELIPDFGDKIWGTLGEDYSIYDIQNELKTIINTQAGKVELLKGTILHLIQMGNSSTYRSDRNASWITKNWLYYALRWYTELYNQPIQIIKWEQLDSIIEELFLRDFVYVEERPWKTGYAHIYSLTEDGFNYISKVYLPILDEVGITKIIHSNFDFLIHLRPREIEEEIEGMLT